MSENELARLAIGCGLKVHKALGPGLLENAYLECLAYEVKQLGLKVEKQKAIPLIYNEVKLEVGYRADLVVEEKLIIELKAVESLTDVHLAQLLTYLRLADCNLGLLMNFNTLLFRDGVRRVIL
ncbi:GxxExxY protein [Haliscomenobacter sp.]|uniref:GxxExxY protein n=1 Tax=Haliscomenobacter sp. TaxID=2717303 RepID=UPI003BA8E2FC